MSGALWAMLACFLAGIGARDQMLLAALTHKLGRHGALLLIAALTASLTSALAAYLSVEIAAALTYPARLVLACMALAAAGAESLLFKPKFAPKLKPREPTRSLFAAALVLAMHQGADAARLLVFAIAMLGSGPIPAASGGALGSLFAATMGWLAAGALLDAQGGIITIRRWAGAALLGAGLGMGLWIWLNLGK